MSAAAPLPPHTPNARLPLLIATALALLLHLAAGLAVAALDRPLPQDASGTETQAAPLTFDLVPAPTPADDPPTKPAPIAEKPPEQSSEAASTPDPASAPPEAVADETSTDPDQLPDQSPDQIEDQIEDQIPDQIEDQIEDQTQDQDQTPTASITATETPPAAQAPLAPALERPSAPPTRQVSAADIFASRNQELASLSRAQHPSQRGATQSRRKAISANTQEYIYANYLESWRRKVERIGNLNYPEEAKEKRLFGSLVLQVSVRADGSLEGVRVLRSSGHQVLDQAAVRIVELAAPFAPFPDDIRAHHDVLDITRTWQFLREHKLGWDK